jgi:Bacterial lectin/PEP-CTERM motif
MIRSAVLITTMCLAIACQPAHGDITGFGDGSGYTLNSISTPAPSINNGTLTLTTSGAAFQSASAFYDTPQSTGSFTAVFTYQASGAADGMTFVIQNDPAGLAALGGAGSGLGYAAAPGYPSQIVNSVGLEVDIYDFTGGPGTNLATQGATGIFNYLSALPVNFNTGDPIKFTITYDATAQTISETLVDTVSPATTYTHTFSGIDIASQVQGSSAYVGFTGGTGGLTSTQTVSGFQFQSSVPEPSSVLLMGLGLGAVVTTRRFRRWM